MSYILEALQKSEQARLQGTDTARLSLLPAGGEAPAPTQLPHYAVLAALVLANAAMLYWRPGSATTSEPPPPTATPQADAAAHPSGLPPRLSTARARASAPAPRALVAAPLQTTPNPAPAAPVAISPPAATPAPAEHPGAADLLKQLPPLAIAGYIHDAGAAPLVIVNDRLLREGDEVVPGLKVEKILGDGLVFNFRGVRFKR